MITYVSRPLSSKTTQPKRTFYYCYSSFIIITRDAFDCNGRMQRSKNMISLLCTVINKLKHKINYKRLNYGVAHLAILYYTSTTKCSTGNRIRCARNFRHSQNLLKDYKVAWNLLRPEQCSRTSIIQTPLCYFHHKSVQISEAHSIIYKVTINYSNITFS